jgi:predicted phosphoribosyltransferase
VIVDDGMATGATMRAACQVVATRKPGPITVAVPVAAQQAIRAVEELCREVVCLHAPARFGAIGSFYSDFGAVSDIEVEEVLLRHAAGT